MSEAALDPAALAAALIRRPSVTPKDEGALDIVAAALEELGFDCHRLVFGDIHNLYARRGSWPPQSVFRRPYRCRADRRRPKPGPSIRSPRPFVTARCAAAAPST